jgi:hypothetical protein
VKKPNQKKCSSGESFMFQKFKFLSFFVFMSLLLVAAPNTGVVAQAYTPYRFYTELPANLGNAIYNNDTVMGMYPETDSIPYTTRVYTRSGTGWVEQAVFLSDEPESNGYVYPLALQENVAIVYDPGQCDADGGAVQRDPYIFVYRRFGTTWTREAKIQQFRYVGCSLKADLDGNTFAVTNSGRYQNEYSGQIYFYEFDGITWVEDAIFLIDQTQGIEGGSSNPVALDGDLAFTLGAQDGNGENNVIRVYKRIGGTWTEQPSLPYPDASGNLEFDGNTLLINQQVYITDGANWTLQASLPPNSNGAYYRSLLVDDTIVLRSASREIYIFTRSGTLWTQQQVLRKPDGTDFDYTAPVSLSGNFLLVGGHLFINTPSPNTELLLNGGFETDSDNNGVPDGWSRKNTTADVRKCNKAGEAPIAFSGNCAYLMKGGTGAKRDLAQNIDLSRFDLNAGDKIRLNGFYNKQSSGDVEVWLFVSYSNLPEQQSRVKMTKMTSGYGAIPQLSLDLRAKPTRVRVVVRNLTTSGKTWFDDISLVKVGTGTQSDLIPLPLQ